MYRWRRRTGRWTRAGVLAAVTCVSSLAVGVLTNLASEDVPPLVRRWAWPLLLAVGAVFIAVSVMQARAGEVGPRGSDRELRERGQVLRLVAGAVRRALDETFAEVPRLPLTLIGRPDLVSAPRPAPDLLTGTRTTAQTVRARHDDLSVTFDACGRSLLLVGEGGSGKTALLAELCLTLCVTEQHQGPPGCIPVLLNLSTWQERDHDLQAWLGRAMSDTYLVPTSTATAWAEAGMLLPVLDGLDEVPETQRGRLREALTDYLKTGPRQVVVSCRHQEYERLGAKLPLAYAVQIQPPSREQVLDYLNRLHSPAAESAAAVPPRDTAWWAMISTPLMLSILARLAATNPHARVVSSGTARQRRRYIIEAYLDALLHRRPTTRPRHTIEDARRGVEWLAEWMSRHKSADFAPDRLHPEWIKDVADPAAVKKRPLRVLSFVQRGVILAALVAVVVDWRLVWAILTFLTITLLVRSEARRNLTRYHCQTDEPIKPVQGPRLLWRDWAVFLAKMFPFVVPWEIGMVTASFRLGLGGSALLGPIPPLLCAIPGMLAFGEPRSIPDSADLPPIARIRRSRTSAWLAVLAVALPISALAGVLEAILFRSILVGIVFSLLCTALSGVGSWLVFGGAAVMQHRAVWQAIARNHLGPPEYPYMLEWLRERLVVHAVGSHYVFAHREVQNHLADAWRKRQPRQPEARSRPAPHRVDI